MHTIRGRLSRAEHVQKAGMAMLSITLEQVGAGGITSQPVEALRSYGNSDIGHAAAHAACASLLLGGLYAVRGKGLSATHMLTGAITVLGTKMRIDARVLAAQTAATAAAKPPADGQVANRSRLPTSKS